MLARAQVSCRCRLPGSQRVRAQTRTFQFSDHCIGIGLLQASHSVDSDALHVDDQRVVEILEEKQFCNVEPSLESSGFEMDCGGDSGLDVCAPSNPQKFTDTENLIRLEVCLRGDAFCDFLACELSDLCDRSQRNEELI